MDDPSVGTDTVVDPPVIAVIELAYGKLLVMFNVSVNEPTVEKKPAVCDLAVFPSV